MENNRKSFSMKTHINSVIRGIGDWFDTHASRHSKPKKLGSFRSKRRKDYIFYGCIVALPLAMLIFNTVFINLNSIMLSFKQYSVQGEESWAGLSNFVKVITFAMEDPVMGYAIRNSLILYVVSVLVTTLIPISFSYYLYKKLPLSELFKVVLFLPSIISSVVTAIIFKLITERVVLTISFKIFGFEMLGLISEPKTAFVTILCYTLWMQLGGGMLIQLSAMNSVDKSVVEAGKLDGVNFLQELWHVVLPSCYQVISIGFFTGIVSIFTNDFGLYAFFGENAAAEVHTIGYYFLKLTMQSSELRYPFLAAWGLLASVIAVPLTFFAKWAIFKFGPQDE